MSGIATRNVCSIGSRSLPRKCCQLGAVAVGVVESMGTLAEGTGLVTEPVCCVWALLTLATHKAAGGCSFALGKGLRLNKSALKGRKPNHPVPPKEVVLIE